jgi:hypothetical protein
MKTLIASSLTLIALSLTLIALSLTLACASAHAGEPVTIVHDVPEVAGCTLLGIVHSTPGHFLVSGAEREVARDTAKLGGDTVLVEKSGLFVVKALAYRCHHE